MDRRSFCLTASAAALHPLGARAADAFPSKPVRIISAYAPGGGPDVQLRQIGPALGEALGQAIVIENKVGAAGVLAAQVGAAAAPDGYTLVMGSNTHLIQKLLKPDLKFDPLTDFAPVSNMASSPTVLVVAAEAPYKTVADLVAAAKTAPGGMNYGSGGIGTSAHLAAATFANLNGLKVTHIPLKGSVEIAGSLLRGDTQFAFPVTGTGIPQVKGGKLRALAVTSRQRLASLPDVPTLYELTKNDLTVQESWFGIWAPARTPPEIVAKLHAAITKALSAPGVAASFEANGAQAAFSDSPQAFAAFVKIENRKWAEIIRLAGVTSE